MTTSYLGTALSDGRPYRPVRELEPVRQQRTLSI